MSRYIGSSLLSCAGLYFLKTVRYTLMAMARFHIASAGRNLDKFRERQVIALAEIITSELGTLEIGREESLARSLLPVCHPVKST